MSSEEAKNQEKILYITKFIKDIKLQKAITTEQTIIIDFYNVYCNFIKFNKYKTFSEKTITNCLNIIVKKLKDNPVILVSKNIFEYEEKCILELTKNNKNITYIIVEDKYLEKSNNRERDDYICILLQKKILLPDIKDPIIITNDKFRNLQTILSEVKSMNISIYNQGNNVANEIINSFSIKKFNEAIKKTKKIKKSQFYFT